ncbi:hypothetical protein BH11PSE6_BH11PSE6_03800 [soil metagenome]
MKISLILQAIDHWSGPANKATEATRALSQKGIRPLEQSMGRMVGPANRARAAINRFWNDAARGERIGRRVGIAMRSMLANISKVALTAAKWGVGGLFAGGAAGLGLFTRGVIATGSSFEQMQSQLETSLGSVDKAKAAVTWIKKFAKDTPYELANVTEAFVSAKLQGLDPFNGSMTALGDGASAMGREFKDAVDAVGDAMNSDNERLRAFGIMASVKGSSTTYSYLTKEGKKATKAVKNDALQIRDALTGIFGEKFGGGMERQSKTLAGIWGNLKDVITLFQLKIADAGFFNHVKNSLKSVYDWSEKIENQAKLEEWAKRISDWLTTIWDKADRFIKDTDWRQVASGIGAIVSTMVEVVSLIGRASSAWSDWQANVERSRLNRIIDSYGWFGPSDATKQQARQRLGELDRSQYGQPQARQRPRGSLSGPTPGVEWPLGSYNRRTGPTGPALLKGGAKISLHVTTDPGVRVRPTAVKARGLDLTVNTGRAMAGAA